MQADVKWATKFRLNSGSWVFVPTEATAKKGRLIKALVQKKWAPPAYFFHHRSGGHVEALKFHADGKFFVRADLKKFFNRINKSRITRELKPLFGYADARAFASESTVPLYTESEVKHVLPFGFVQSSILASLCLYKSALGRVIRELNQVAGTKVSVYVDDIIVSTQDIEAASNAFEKLLDASERSALPLNMEKSTGPSETIVVFNVDLAEESIVVSEKRMGEFLLSYMETENESRREGILGYLRSINVDQAAGFEASVAGTQL